MYVGAFFKDSCFEVEKEFRLVYNLYLDDKGKYATIDDKQDFYEKNGIFIPYVDIKYKPEKLLGIGISPTLDYKETKDSILRITDAKYTNIKEDSIYKSKIPVRY